MSNPSSPSQQQFLRCDLTDLGHSGILACDIPSDQQDLAAQSTVPISIVVCNLYPFTLTIARPGCMLADAVEDIDISGVTLLRAAAKNHGMSVLSDLAVTADFALAWEGDGEVGAALKAFEMTAKYDTAIGAYFRKQYANATGGEKVTGPAQRLVLDDKGQIVWKAEMAQKGSLLSTLEIWE